VKRQMQKLIIKFQVNMRKRKKRKSQLQQRNVIRRRKLRPLLLMRDQVIT
jgi:hypothetical protein